MKATLFANPPGKNNLMVAKVRRPVTDLDLRDLVGTLVGGGYTSISDDDAKAAYGKMSQIMGPQEATNMLVHIFQQNKRPEMQAAKPEDRVTRFYDLRSSHVPTDEAVQQLKALGTGPTSGYNSSVNLINQQQQGTAGYNPVLAAIQGRR